MKPIYIKVGGTGPYDPAAGTTDCNIPSLKGMDIYLVSVAPSLYTILSTGGFRVITPFTLNSEYYVQASGIGYGTDETNYTNGFNSSLVYAALFGRVGWAQPADAASPVLNSVNLISKSGRNFNDGSFHTLVTLDNIKATMEQKDASDADFNAYLEGLQKAAQLKALNGVFNEPEFIDQSLLYTRWGYVDTPIANAGKFIACRIKVPPAADLAVQIDSVGLYFDGAATFNLYLFNDSKLAPVWVGSVTTVANTQTVINLSDIVLNHIGGNNLGGVFYFGYFQNDLGSVRAIRESSTRFSISKPYSASMIEAVPVGSNDFQRNNIGYSIFQTYGINPHLSVFRDHTQQITRKATLFDNLQGLQMAVMVLELITYSKRSNADERVLKDTSGQINASLDLQGAAPMSDGPRTVGLKTMIQKEALRVKNSFFPPAQPQSIEIC